ncbi:MAG TPA: ABC transporter permease [Verrucomicrobiae bacterium]|nr:ABC transporter permease [Verrucomicrobiae bacterium]
MKRYFLGTWAFALTQIRRFFRDPVALFFTFLFPLLFLFVFGSLFKNSGDVSFTVALINKSETPFSKQFVSELKKNKGLEIDQKVTSIDQGRELMGRGQLDSIVELPENFGTPGQNKLPSGKLIVYYEASSAQTGQTVGALMQGVLDGINRQLTGAVEPFVVEQKSTQTADLSQFDYTFSGLLGFSLLSLGIFGLANGLPSDKKAGMLRRLRATPLRASQLVLGTMINYVLIGVLSIILMFLVGALLFDFTMRGDYLSFSIFMLLGMVTMLGFGLAIGGWAKNEIQAAPLSNLVAFPMMFLSGSFFPRFLMPEWLQAVTQYLPLTPIIDGIRYITTEGKHLFQLGPELLIIAVWAVVIYAISFKVFRWE